MIFTPQEIIDAIIMSLGVGFIFKDLISDSIPREYDPLKVNPFGIDWKGFWIAVAITAPAVVVHELAHKITALIYGLTATFHAAYTWLLIGIVLKLFNAPFIFFVPGYVSISGYASPLIHALVAFAGPFLNLVLWLSAYTLYKFKIVRKKKYVPILILTSKINMFLFIFNMLPLPIFDGWTVYSGIFKAFL